MPRRKSLVTVIRDLVREQVQATPEAQTARTGTTARIEDTDASGTRASAQGRASSPAADTDAQAAQATRTGEAAEAGEGGMRTGTSRAIRQAVLPAALLGLFTAGCARLGDHGVQAARPGGANAPQHIATRGTIPPAFLDL